MSKENRRPPGAFSDSIRRPTIESSIGEAHADGNRLPNFQVVIPNEVRDALHTSSANLTGVLVLSKSRTAHRSAMMFLVFELDFLPIDVSSVGATVRMRERIRTAIAAQCEVSAWEQPVTIEIDAWHVRPFDLDNVAKQILDALSAPLATRDGSVYARHATLPDDDVRYVNAVHIRGSIAARTCIRVRVTPSHSEEALRDT